MTKKDKEELRLMIIDTIGCLEEIRYSQDKLDQLISKLRSQLKELN